MPTISNNPVNGIDPSGHTNCNVVIGHRGPISDDSCVDAARTNQAGAVTYSYPGTGGGNGDKESNNNEPGF